LPFNAMNLGVFQLMQAKRDQIEAARAYVQALREYWTARAEVDQLLAGRLPRRAATGDAETTNVPKAPARPRATDWHARTAKQGSARARG
jgi:cobalt-zinc-cadmium efflux system outer membrane protein